MSLITKLFLDFCNYLPWLAIALVAGLALRKKKDSTALLLQAGSAAALFLLALGRWFIVTLLLGTLVKAGPKVMEASHIIFAFLLFVALVGFAVGYCAERLKRQ